MITQKDCSSEKELKLFVLRVSKDYLILCIYNLTSKLEEERERRSAFD